MRTHAPDMTPAGVNDKRFLEREAEVAALDDAIRAAAAGNGSAVIVEGTLWWGSAGPARSTAAGYRQGMNSRRRDT